MALKEIIDIGGLDVVVQLVSDELIKVIGFSGCAEAGNFRCSGNARSQASFQNVSAIHSISLSVVNHEMSFGCAQYCLSEALVQESAR